MRISSGATTGGPGDDAAWSNIVGLADVDRTAAINALNNTKPFIGPTINENISLVPAAFSVQIMNKEALQTTSGIMYVGRCLTTLDLRNNAGTWDNLLDDLISFQAPRLLAAAKLAFKGVQVDALPSNMSQLADFNIPVQSTSSPFTWSGTGNKSSVVHAGFLPLFILNPDGVDLRVQVTVEYRARFDPFSPAVASHQYHHPAPLSTWDRAVSTMQSLGHGVREIADVVATAGTAMNSVNAARQAITNRPMVPMLVD